MHAVVLGDFDATPDSASLSFLRGRRPVDGFSVCYQDVWEYLHPDDPGRTFDLENVTVAHNTAADGGGLYDTTDEGEDPEAPVTETAVTTEDSIIAENTAQKDRAERLAVGQAPVVFDTADSPACTDCGSIMVRNGSCYKCINCGATSGCS